jgi:hypothetical protein
MVARIVKAVLMLTCIVGLFFLPMSNVLLYNEPLLSSISDFTRATAEKAEHTDYHSTDISTYTNDEFIFYVPPPVTKSMERPSTWYGYQYKWGDYVMANLSCIQVFSYENGAKVKLEWMNATVINKAEFDQDNQAWILSQDYEMKWTEHLGNGLDLSKKIELDEYESWEIRLNDWIVKDDFRIMSGVIRITSDYPISVMHHKLYPTGTLDKNGNNMINENWNGVYSAYGKKLFTRITGDCWISALEADTTIQVWDYSDKNDDTVLELDRFEGWAYCRNPIFEQFGFDDDEVLISADKPVSIVAGLQSDQSFVQVHGKDAKDFLFPCFGKVLIHAPTGANIDLEDTNGNQGSFKGTLKPGQTRIFDFKVAYKLRRYSSFEWATLRSSEPVNVYSFTNSQWYLDEDRMNRVSGEEYITVNKKITGLYSHGWIPYPAGSSFNLPVRGRSYLTVVNLDNRDNGVEVDFTELLMPYDTKLDPYESLTIEFSEDSYYYMDMVIRDTGYTQPPEWNLKDPDNRFMLDSIPRIAVDRGERETIFLSDENITKGSNVRIKTDENVLVFLNYDRDQLNSAQGMDLIPGLTPPTIRGMPDLKVIIVTVSGLIIALDMLIVAQGHQTIFQFFTKKKGAVSVDTLGRDG